MEKICKSNEANPPEIFVIDGLVYPGGATGFTIIADSIGATIDGAGQITVASNDLPVGIYTITVQYIVGEITETFAVRFAMIDCEKKLLESSFTFCGLGGTEQTQQLQFNTGETYTDWALIVPVIGVTVSPTGLLTVTTDEAESGAVELEYNEGVKITINITIATCGNPTHLNFTECPKEPLGIVWVNKEGGRQSYVFNQPKEYTTDQEDGETWDNSARERRYFTRGRISDAIDIVQENIPVEHLTTLRSLKNSIQAWVCGDISDTTSYQAILIVPGSFYNRKTTDRFYTFAFKFNYAIPELIQNQ